MITLLILNWMTSPPVYPIVNGLLIVIKLLLTMQVMLLPRNFRSVRKQVETFQFEIENAVGKYTVK